MAKGTIARSGNSYVIRVPKSYVTDHGLRLGDKVDLPHPRVGQERALERLLEYAQQRGDLGILDPVEWQRQQRVASDPWDEIADDPA